MKKTMFLIFLAGLTFLGCESNTKGECCENCKMTSDSLCVTKCDSLHNCINSTSCK